MPQCHASGGGHAAEVAGDGVGLRVVREHAAHAHAAAAERGERLLEEGGAAGAALVGQDGDVGVAAVVVDGDVEVVEAAGARGPGGAPAHAVPAALGDAAQLFHVDMQQVAGGGVLVADHRAGDAVQPVEAVETEAPEHGVGGGAGDPERPGDAVRPEPLAAAHGADALLERGCGAARVGARSGAAVAEPGRTLLPVAAPPLGDRRTSNPEAPRNFRLRPAGLDLQNQLQPGGRSQTRVRMCHERLLSCYWCVRFTHTAAGGAPHLSTTYVGTTADME